MPRLIVTKRFSFRSVHALTSGANRERTHGHEYHLEVSVNDSEALSLVNDFFIQNLKPQLHARELKGELQPSTGEHIVNWIEGQFLSSSLAPFVVGVALQETKKNRFIASHSYLFNELLCD